VDETVDAAKILHIAVDEMDYMRNYVGFQKFEDNPIRSGAPANSTFMRATTTFSPH
jgi:hypothetical protein